MPNEQQLKPKHPKLVEEDLESEPYFQCTCDLEEHFNYVVSQGKELRVFHTTGTVTTHLPECLAFGLKRQKSYDIVDLTFDPYEHCKCGLNRKLDPDFDNMIASGGIICTIHKECAPSYHFQECGYARAEQMGRMRRYDKKQREEQKRAREIVDSMKSAPMITKRTSITKAKIQSRMRRNPYHPCYCNFDDNFDELVATGRVIRMIHDDGKSWNHLYSCRTWGLSARKRKAKKNRPAFVEKPHTSNTTFEEEPAKTSPALQYDPRTIASDVLHALGIDPYSLMLEAQPSKRRRRHSILR